VKDTSPRFPGPYHKKVGFIPNFRGEANFIKLVLSHPCAQPWFLLVETFIPAFLKFAITTTVPMWDDIVIAGARAVANAPTGRGLRHVRQRNIDMQEIRDMKSEAKALRWLLILEAPLETIGFWWLVFSATDQFFYDWASLLRERKFCTAATSSGPFQRSTVNSLANFNTTGDSFGLDVLDQNRAGWPNNDFGVDVPDGIYTVILTITVHDAITDGFDDCGVRIKVTGALGSTNYDSDLERIPGPAGAVTFIATAQIIAHAISNTILWQSFSPTHALALGTITEGRVIVTRNA